MPTLISGSTGVNKITDGTIVNADIASGAAIAATKLGAGAVLQVVSTTVTAASNTNPSSSWTDVAGLTLDITPASASNKIFLTGVVKGIGEEAVNNTGYRILKDGSEIAYRGDAASSRSRSFSSLVGDSSDDSIGNHSINFLDTAGSSGSAITYKVQMYSNNIVYMNRNKNDAENVDQHRVASTLTAMEIGV